MHLGGSFDISVEISFQFKHVFGDQGMVCSFFKILTSSLGSEHVVPKHFGQLQMDGLGD